MEACRDTSVTAVLVLCISRTEATMKWSTMKWIAVCCASAYALWSIPPAQALFSLSNEECISNNQGGCQVIDNLNQCTTGGPCIAGGQALTCAFNAQDQCGCTGPVYLGGPPVNTTCTANNYVCQVVTSTQCVTGGPCVTRGHPTGTCGFVPGTGTCVCD